MRADRLLALLMILQARGRVTAESLAAELEVSERTIYRDIDALSAAGVPVYGDPGPHGGYALLDEYRTRLTGLTENEARALFMLSIPAPLERLGMDEDLKAAMRKLSASLPDARRSDERRVHQRFLLDAMWWHQADERAPHMQVLHGAVWRDCLLRITYRTHFSGEIVQTVAPYGLVAKAGVWYLVFLKSDRWRAMRVSELIDVSDAGETFERDARFVLRDFWDAWCKRHEALFVRYTVKARVAPQSMAELRRLFGGRVTELDADDTSVGADAWTTVELSFESLEAARYQLLGFGRGIEVVEPVALRRSVIDYAEQIVGLYRTE